MLATQSRRARHSSNDRGRLTSPAACARTTEDSQCSPKRLQPDTTRKVDILAHPAARHDDVRLGTQDPPLPTGVQRGET